MGKRSTLIYLFNNFDEFNNISDGLKEYELNEYGKLLDKLNLGIKKVPDRIINNVLQFAKDYSQ